jgi:hypothetical protein
VPAVLGLSIGLVGGAAFGLLALAYRWPGRYVATATALLMLAGIVAGIKRLSATLLTTEQVTDYAAPAEPLAEPEAATNWEMPNGPGSYFRGTLPAPPEIIVAWARAAIAEQSLSYASWADKFGGDRKYARYRRVLIESGLCAERGSNKELALTSKGWAFFSQAAEKPTPLLADLEPLQGRGDGETQ